MQDLLVPLVPSSAAQWSKPSALRPHALGLELPIASPHYKRVFSSFLLSTHVMDSQDFTGELGQTGYIWRYLVHFGTKWSPDGS